MCTLCPVCSVRTNKIKHNYRRLKGKSRLSESSHLQTVRHVRIKTTQVATHHKRNDQPIDAPLVALLNQHHVVVHRIDHLRNVARRRLVVLAHDKRLDAGIARASRLGDRNLFEEDLELRVQQCGILAAKDLGHESATGGQHVRGDAEGGEQEL